MLITTLGPKEASDLGMILPHEHVFVDLRQGNPPDFAQAGAADVIVTVRPNIEAIRALGVTALVECTPVGVGRRADLVKAVSDALDFPIVVPTGIYREPWVPQWAHEASEDKLVEWMVDELQNTIGDSGVQAGWIKLSAGDDGLTTTETKILRAAARAGRETNALIGSHTIRGRVVRDQLDVIEAAGYSAERFVWIHTQAEENRALHLEIARRGAWIEYDWIGNQPTDEVYVEMIQDVLDAGLEDHLLISHDRGWYDAGIPGGGTPKSLTYINETFLPKLRAAGIADATLHQLTHTNPFRAFAR